MKYNKKPHTNLVFLYLMLKIKNIVAMTIPNAATVHMMIYSGRDKIINFVTVLMESFGTFPKRQISNLNDHTYTNIFVLKYQFKYSHILYKIIASHANSAQRNQGSDQIYEACFKHICLSTVKQISL